MMSSPPLPKLSTFLRPQPTANSPTSESHGHFNSPPVVFSVSSSDQQQTPPAHDSEHNESVFARSIPAKATSTRSSKSVQVRERTSRYLSGADRQVIIDRINAGEKQVALAREYGVSRAAVCNLYKHWRQGSKRSRRDRRQARSDDSDTSSMASSSPVTTSTFTQQWQQENQSYPSEDHRVSFSLDEPEHSPTRPSFQDVASLVPEVAPDTRGLVASMWTPYVPFRVHEASTSSLAIRRLVGDLRDANCVGTEFRKYASRLMRLLIEEALTQLPSHEIEVQTSCGDICRVARPMDERDIIGITMEQSPSYLFEAFSVIQPNAPSGFVELDRPISTEDAFKKSSSTNSQLPRTNSRNVTMLLDVECTTGAEACAAIQHLVNACAVDPATIYFVTVISSRPGLEFIHEAYPGESVHS